MTDKTRGTLMTRKTTVFETCEQHGWLKHETRDRMAETFCEGGPAQGRPCTGNGCRIRPGTDLFCPELCDQRGWYPTDAGPFVWGVNVGA